MPDKMFVAAKAAIWKGDKLFMQREIKQEGIEVLDLPGGRIDIGESPRDGLKREVMEEIGVEIHNISEMPVRIWSQKTSNGTGIVILLYEAEFVSENFNLNNVPDIVQKEDKQVYYEVLDTDYVTYDQCVKLCDPMKKDRVIEYFKQKQGL